MSRTIISSPRTSLAGSLRWVLLGLVTTGSLALLALFDGSRDPGAATHSGTAPATSQDDATRGPGGATWPGDPMHDPAARLGAAFEPLTGDAAQTLGLAAGTALRVLAIEPESQAERAGLRANDVVTAIAGPVGPGTAGTATTSATWAALCAALDDRPSGGALDFFVRRDGRTRIVHLTLDPLEEAARAIADAPDRRQTACV